MARLQISGWETNSATDASVIVGTPTAPTVQSTVVRSGKHAAQCNAGAGNAAVLAISAAAITGVASTTYYIRQCYCFANLPGSAVRILATDTSGAANAVDVKLTAAGKLQLWNRAAGTQIGSDSAATIAANSATWYRVELSVTVSGAGTTFSACELRLDDATVASTSGIAIASNNIQPNMGWLDSPGANSIVYLDDYSLNDSTGAAQNSWCGNGKLVLLSPVSDNAKGTGWTNDAASSTSLFPSVDNEPPAGVADTTTGTGLQQIRNATSNANSNYDTNLGAYSDSLASGGGGIGGSDTINVLTPVIVTAAPVSTSAKQGTVGVVSNPTITNVALAAGGTSGAFWSGIAAGAYPSGWKWSNGTPTYALTVTLATKPVMRITQVTASTRIAMVCFMGVYVDYTPAAALTPPPPRPLVVGQAIQRAASR